MSKLTLDEAIKHCLEVAEQQEISVDNKEMYSEMLGEDYKGFEEGCQECAADHRQLAEWLMELKDLKAEQNDQYVFIHELMSELKEAKRLLKAAVEDISERIYCTKVCKRDYFACHALNTCDFKWRYADEAQELLNDEK